MCIRPATLRPTLVVICGLSFAGKTTLGDAIRTALGHVQVDVDFTKADLYGDGVADGDLGPDQWTRIYDETDNRIATHLREGRNVVDASRNFRRRERDRARAVAGRVEADTLVVYVDTPESLCRQRWLDNREKQIRRDVTDDGFEEVVAAMEPPTPEENALVFRHSDGIRRWLVDHAEEIRRPKKHTVEQPAAAGCAGRGG